MSAIVVNNAATNNRSGAVKLSVSQHSMRRHIDQRCYDLADHLMAIERQIADPCSSNRPTTVEKFRHSAVWLCKRLLAAHTASPTTGMRISKDKNRYSKGRYVPKGLSYDITIARVLSLMMIDGFVREVRGGSYDRTKGEGEQTRIAAKDKLLDWFAADPALLPKALVGCEDADPIVVQITGKRKGKNKNGKEVTFKTKTLKPYTDDANTNQMRDNLNIINDCLKRHWSDLRLSDDGWVKLQRSLVANKKYDYNPIQLHRQTIRRIFNSTSFDIGGRFYGGWWQNIPSAYRAFITIDGKRTVEFDYGSLHPTILYAQKGLTLCDKAYDIGIGRGDEHKDVIKQLFNAMVQMKEPQDRPPRGVKFRQTGKTWKQLRDLILEKHEPIRDKFFCGLGNRLQFYDSQIAERVMLHFAKRDIPVLPVHDSFIMHHAYGEELGELEEAMRRAFYEHFKKDINVKSEIGVMLPSSFDGKEWRDLSFEQQVQGPPEYSQWEDRNP